MTEEIIKWAGVFTISGLGLFVGIAYALSLYMGKDCALALTLLCGVCTISGLTYGRGID